MTESNPRRERAADLFENGASQADVARELRVSRVTAMKWHRLWQAAGRSALVAARRPGRKPKLSPDAETHVHQALHRTPQDAGIDMDEWSLASAALLIERLTGVRYHPRHVSRWLRRAGWLVPPVGRSAAYAVQSRQIADTDGNRVLLLKRREPDSR